MFNHFISEEEVKRSQLISLILAKFEPFSVSEIQILFETTRDMLMNLNENDPDFNSKIKQIILGTIEFSIQICNKKFSPGLRSPALLDNFNNLVTRIRMLRERPKMDNIILELGENILNENKFDMSSLSKDFPELIEAIPQIEIFFKNDQLLIEPTSSTLTFQPVLPGETHSPSELIIDIDLYRFTFNPQLMPLIFKAVYLGDSDLVKQLFSAGVNLFFTYPIFNLHLDIVSFAAYLGKTDIVHYLLPAFEQLKRQHFANSTPRVLIPLFWAVLGNNTEIVQLLLNYYQQNQTDMQRIVSQFVKITRGTLTHEVSIVDIAISHNIDAIIKTLLPFINTVSERYIHIALKNQQEEFLLKMIGMDIFSDEEWFKFIFSAKSFKDNFLSLKLLNNLLSKKQNYSSEEELRSSVHDYLISDPEFLSEIMKENKLRLSGFEFLLPDFLKIYSQFEAEDKLYFFCYLIFFDKLSIAPESIHPLLLKEDDQSTWFYMLLGCYMKKIKHGIENNESMNFIREQLNKLITIDFNNKFKFLLTQAEYFFEKLPQKLEKFSLFLELAEQLAPQEKIKFLANLYVFSGFKHQLEWLNYFESKLSAVGLFLIDFYLKAFSEARRYLDIDPPLMNPHEF